jgi:hypothetical protein
VVKHSHLNIAGIQEEAGTVTFRKCMDEKQWANLKAHEIMYVDTIERSKRLYFCDYCEERL